MPITSIDCNKGILNYLKILNLNISKPQFNHIATLMTGIINIDSKRNISNISSKILYSKDRSCVTKFLNNAPWCARDMQDTRINHVLSVIEPKAKRMVPLHCSITVYHR
ncbi:hypothetical protein QBE52_04320 [Clostridiaceae bacterium 35-E11]